MAIHTVRDLPGLPGVQSFDVGEKFVTIPGVGSGPDGPTQPEHPAQEAWMRDRSGLTEVWYLTWELPSAERRRAFLALLNVTEP